jgi:hypothetical protein
MAFSSITLMRMKSGVHIKISEIDLNAKPRPKRKMKIPLNSG